jgi:hypothetical protein
VFTLDRIRALEAALQGAATLTRSGLPYMPRGAVVPRRIFSKEAQ